MGLLDTAPVFLLVVAMAAFVASTVQMRLLFRSVAWGVGAVMLVGSIIVAFSRPGRRGFFRVLEDAAQNAADPSQSVLAQSFARNGGQIIGDLIAILDIFLIVGVILGIVALVAFTPGEKLEKAARPVMYGLIGAVFGGALALTVASLGLGDVVKQRLYAAEITDDKIQDGDTFWIGEYSLRLYGVDAPELDQVCLSRSGSFISCGELVRGQLAEIVRGKLVTCTAADLTGAGIPKESFGRPLVNCYIQENGGPIDLAKTLVSQGLAFPYPGFEKAYLKETAIARANPLGFASSCTLQPSAWRSSPQYASIFEQRNARRISEIPAENLVAGCANRITSAPAG